MINEEYTMEIKRLNEYIQSLENELKNAINENIELKQSVDLLTKTLMGLTQ